MSDEARDIAHDRALYAFEGETNLPMVTSDIAQYWGYVGFEAGFTAGVAEGIRQAREAVEGEDLSDDTGDRGDVTYRAAIFDALAAIDALGEDDRG